MAWILVAIAAVGYSQKYHGGDAFNAVIAVIATVFGISLAVRMCRQKLVADSAAPSPPEPWFRRVQGGFAAVVWCLVAVAWNLGVFGSLARSAREGQTLTLAILVPFSLIGWFLLLVLFTCIAVLLDSAFRLGGQPSATEPAVLPPAPCPPAKAENALSLADSPILGSLALLAFVNWFVCMGVHLYMGGDALGILPSSDGFVVKSHGHRAPVSEAAWVFNLFYSAATFLLSPMVVSLFAAKQARGQWKPGRWPLKIFVSLFIIVWAAGWYSSIGSSFFRSFENWREFKPILRAP
jgi:hypothetical protein